MRAQSEEYACGKHANSLRMKEVLHRPRLGQPNRSIDESHTPLLVMACMRWTRRRGRGAALAWGLGWILFGGWGECPLVGE